MMVGTAAEVENPCKQAGVGRPRWTFDQVQD